MTSPVILLMAVALCFTAGLIAALIVLESRNATNGRPGRHSQGDGHSGGKD